MIDYIKVAIDLHYHSILKEKVKMSESKVDPETQDILTETGKYENMKIVFGWTNHPKTGARLSSITLSGSIHNYWNRISKDQDQNYDDFDLESIREALDHLEECLGIKFRKSKLQNLEFGLNILLSSDVGVFIDEKVVSYEFKGPSLDKDYGIYGRIKEFTTSQYWVKIYDKGRKYQLNKDLLRIEIKYKRSTLLKSLGINCVDDILNHKNLHILSRDYLTRIKKDLLIVDTTNFEFVKDLNKRQILNDGMSPIWWKAFPTTQSKIRCSTKSISYSTVRRHKITFKELLKEFGLTSLKEEVISKLELKLIELSGVKYKAMP